MGKELKIVLSTFAVFFIYGLVPIFYVGKFASPVFLNQLVVLGLSILFFAFNRTQKGDHILLMFVVVQFFSCMVDGFTVSYLSQKFGIDIFLDLYNSLVFGLSFLLVYFGFFIYVSLYLHKFHANKLITGSLIVLILATIYLLLFQEISWLHDVVFSFFLLYLTFLVHKKMNEELRVLQVVTYLFTLIVLLEGMEYFQ